MRRIFTVVTILAISWALAAAFFVAAYSQGRKISSKFRSKPASARSLELTNATLAIIYDGFTRLTLKDRGNEIISFALPNGYYITTNPPVTTLTIERNGR